MKKLYNSLTKKTNKKKDKMIHLPHMGDIINNHNIKNYK